jgi:predicted flap endonuclease-1-like 5' DNA nuclease
VSARGAGADDLKLIKGIGNQNEARLHALGVWHFDQISGWSVENVKWVGSYLAFPGRIDREQWIAQARDLAAGRKGEFARRAEAGLVKSSADDGSHGRGDIAKVDPRR